MIHSPLKSSLAGVLAALCLVLGSVGALAQDEIAAAGNGGTADCSANGGAVAIGDANSGGNAGNAIGVGDSVGDVAVDGGAIANSTDLAASVNGGTGLCDASGGDDNVGFLVDRIVQPAPEPPPPPPPPPPLPPPPPPEPVEPFQVCVTEVEQGPLGCGPGACDAASGPASCTLVDCGSVLEGFPPGPCTIPSQFCEVNGNVGNCVVVISS